MERLIAEPHCIVPNAAFSMQTKIEENRFMPLVCQEFSCIAYRASHRRYSEAVGGTHKNSSVVHFDKAVEHAFFKTEMCVTISEACHRSGAKEKCLWFLV